MIQIIIIIKLRKDKQKMGYGIKIMVTGDYALFSRPEMKVERVSYDVPTPSAMVGLISSVYWHPGIKYVIDKIYVYNPINFVNIRRNEVSDKLSHTAVKNQMKGKVDDISIYTCENRTQRANLLLKDVKYGVEFHFEITDEADETQTSEKSYNILLRRLRKGQYFSKPCLGCREFTADVELVEELPNSEFTGDIDFGYMLYDLQYEKTAEGKALDCAEPRFFRPHMIDGMIDVRRYSKDLLC